MTKEDIGKFIKIFIFFSLVILIIINWETIKGIFNYQSIYGDIMNSLKIKKEKEVVLTVPEIELSEPKKEAKYTEKSDSVEIPKIGVSAPLIFIEGTNNKDYEKALKQGVVHYSQSALPGENGQTIILGHSAPAGWPKINYDWIFSKINELKTGDEVFVYYQNHEYRYLVTKNYILKSGDDIPKGDLTNSKNMLILISCWPPGVNLKRIAVEAELTQ
jgi:LPXTG-site transpeptidase (sortase) family protein